MMEMGNVTVKDILEVMEKRIRFEGKRGMLSVEDLMHIPLEELDEICVELYKKCGEPVSFLRNASNEENKYRLMFRVAKTILDYRREKLEIEEREMRLREQQKIAVEILLKEKIKELPFEYIKKVMNKEMTFEEAIEEYERNKKKGKKRGK
jgi:hypothetical protein